MLSITRFSFGSSLICATGMATALIAGTLTATGCNKPQAPAPAKNEAPKNSESKPEIAKADKAADPVKATNDLGKSELAKTESTQPPAPEQVVVAKPVTKGPMEGGDWPMWGGTPIRNNVAQGKDIPTDWNTGSFDRKTGEWNPAKSKNVLWASQLGSQSYGNPVVAGGKVFVGTNNNHGYLKRYPSEVDLGCLLCFDASNGKFLWQHSSEKLKTGRVHDWPLMGICSSSYVEGDRLWFATSRGEVRCLDVNGFYDGVNNGPFKDEPNENKDEADVIWSLDMMKELGISQHNMCSCSIAAHGDILFVITGNGVDDGHIVLPSPNAPSFLALDKNTGKVLWTDKSPGENIMHGQWSSPAIAEIGGVLQAIFCGGDGYLYSFKADAGKDGKPELLWKFDTNPKESKYILGGRGTRNELIATPVVYKDRVYISVGQDPEHGEGIGHMWCIDPTKRGDISPTLVVKRDDKTKVAPHRRIQALLADEGEIEIPNPNAGMIWHFSEFDGNKDGKIDFEETMHRTIGTVVIADDLVFCADFSGLFHCIDAMTGKPYWSYDMLAASWGSPLIVDGKVYIGDEDGDVAIFNVSKEKHDPVAEINVGNSVYSTPVVANNVLYIANRTHIFAIQAGAKPVVPPASAAAATKSEE